MLDVQRDKRDEGAGSEAAQPLSFAPFALAARGLACRRGGRLIFADLDFRLSNGQAIALTGRNGAGKSSLIALLLGRLRAEAGELELSGFGESTLAEIAHCVGHRDGLKTALTVRENLVFAQALLGTPAMSVIEALDAVGLPHVAHLPAGYLSAGQSRRVALARLLVSSRPLWLLDEPLAALDAASQTLLAGLMKAHLARGGAILAATHGPLGLDEVGDLRIGP